MPVVKKSKKGPSRKAKRKPRLHIFLPTRLFTLHQIMKQHSAIKEGPHELLPQQATGSERKSKKAYKKIIHKQDSTYSKEKASLIKEYNNLAHLFSNQLKFDENSDALISGIEVHLGNTQNSFINIFEYQLWKKTQEALKSRRETGKKRSKGGYEVHLPVSFSSPTTDYIREERPVFLQYHNDYKLSFDYLRDEFLYNPFYAEKNFTKSLTMMSLATLESYFLDFSNTTFTGLEKSKKNYILLKSTQEYLKNNLKLSLDFEGSLSNLIRTFHSPELAPYYEFNDDINIYPSAYCISQNLREMNNGEVALFLNDESISIYTKVNEMITHKANWSLLSGDREKDLHDEFPEETVYPLQNTYDLEMPNYLRRDFKVFDPNYTAQYHHPVQSGLTSLETEHLSSSSGLFFQKHSLNKIFFIPIGMRLKDDQSFSCPTLFRADHELGKVYSDRDSVEEYISERENLNEMTLFGSQTGKYFDFEVEPSEGIYPVIFYCPYGYLRINNQKEFLSFLKDNFEIEDPVGKFYVKGGIGPDLGVKYVEDKKLSDFFTQFNED